MKVKEIKKSKELMTQQLSTPVGIAKFPKLSEPDTQFDPEGVFSVGLLLKDEAADLVKEAVEKFYEVSKEHAETVLGKKVRGADLPLKEDTDKDGNETGFTLFRAKSKSKVMKVVPIFDKFGDRTEESVTPGSKIKLAVTLASYVIGGRFGVSVRLNGVLLLEKKQFKDSAESMFDGEFEDKPEESEELESDSIF